jgi:hypothetical protein
MSEQPQVRDCLCKFCIRERCYRLPTEIDLPAHIGQCSGCDAVGPVWDMDSLIKAWDENDVSD